ncbi:MAG: ABC transporter permease [Marinomonas sp.]|jgi:ribose transport system permease protein|uniref:ABC transporter permease n=1 Tax=Marinomonas TaxID=28253 RepID=UPI001054C601|nr:ABC transporter permease [Marinomonas sp. KMM3893]
MNILSMVSNLPGMKRKAHSSRQAEGVLVALVVITLFASLRYDAFLSEYNIMTFLAYNSMFILIGLGMCFVIMTGGIDLSVGSVVALSSVVVAKVSEYGIEVALPVGILVGVTTGAINAFVITRLKIVPFIATLAMMLGARGMALVISGNQSVDVSWESNFTQFGLGKMFDFIPWPVVAMLVAFAFCWLLLEKFAFGRHVLAIGGNEEASKLMGLEVNRTLFGVYVLSGALAGLSGVMLASGFGAGQPLEGLGWELSAIAAVVVGGTLLTGGLGSITSTLLGAILLGLIFNILNFENGLGTISFSAYWQSVIRGGFLLVVVIIQAKIMNRKKAHS